MRILLEEASILLARLGCSVEVFPFFDGKPTDQADVTLRCRLQNNSNRTLSNSFMSYKFYNKHIFPS